MSWEAAKGADRGVNAAFAILFGPFRYVAAKQEPGIAQVNMLRRAAILTLCGAGTLGLPAPLFADVKAGVDAWSAGDFATAVREWREPASNGDPDAQFNLGQAYRLGRGVEMDLIQAEAFYSAAAASGHRRAADNFGLLLFQRGQRERAMPYIVEAAGRGDARAQYFLGVAHFNGELVAKDWILGYALTWLASEAGLPQADQALAQMEAHVSPEQRQQAQVLAVEVKAQAQARREKELEEVELASGQLPTSTPVIAAAAPPAPPPPPDQGAKHPLPTPAPTSVNRLAKPAPVPARSASDWKLQLGSFSNAANADRLWTELAKRAEIAGRQKLKIASGKLTVLYAGGYTSESEARLACSSLKRTGQDCIVRR